MFLGFSERNIFGRALFPTLPIGETRVFNLLFIDEFADKYGIPFSAWSIARRLWSNYTGNLIEVRRLSDGALLDIGFDANNELDLATLTGFIGAGSGFIRTLYDQTGTGNNFVQTTLANQPRIVNAGVVDTVNGKPSAFFDGANDHMTIPSSTATYNWMHNLTDGVFTQKVNIVAQAGLSSNPNAAYSFLGNNGFTTADVGFGLIYDDRLIFSRNNQYWSIVTNGSAGQSVISAQYNNELTPNQLVAIADFFARFETAAAFVINKEYMQINQGIKRINTFNATASNSNASNNLQLGASGRTTVFLNGYISEVIMYRGDNSAIENNSDIHQNQKDFYAIP